MSGHYVRKRARSAGWAWSLAAFALALLLVSLVFFRQAAIDLQVFALSVLTVACMVVLALLTSLFAMSRAWWRGDRGGGRAVAAFALATLLAIPFAFGASLAIEYPSGAAAQTDGMIVPVTERDLASTPDLLLGRDYRATAAEVYSVSRNVLEDSGWAVTSVEASALLEPQEGDLGISGLVTAPIPTLRDTLPAEGEDDTPEIDRYAASDSDSYVIDAVARMQVLGLSSDFTIRIVEEGGQSFVDVRSASRDLPRDLGQNRRFIEGFFARLDAAMELLRTGPVES